MEIKWYVFPIRALSCTLIFTLCLAMLIGLTACGTLTTINPLGIASRDGDLESVKSLLESGADVNEIDNSYYTALHYAVSHGHINIVRILLEKGANVNEKGGWRNTALHMAISRGDPEMVRILLEKGANVNEKAFKIAEKKADTKILRILMKLEEEPYVTAKKPISSVAKIAPVAKSTEVEIEPIYEKPPKIEKMVKPPNVGKYYAVVIGIGKYQDDRIPKLKYTTVDAEAIYNILTDPQYGNFPKNQVKLLIDEQATYYNIKSAIGTWLRRNTRKDDTVIIFYAGHGAPEDEKTYWVTYNANIDDLYGTALSNDEIADMLSRVEAKKMIAFLDSCYSAATVHRTDKKRSIIIAKDPFQKFKGKGRVIITSSDGKEQSLEIEKFGHGVFTYYLLEALKGESDENKDGFVELDEVWDYVKYRVTDTARKHGSTQTPILDGSYSAGIVLSKHPERLKELNLEAEREKKEKELEAKIAKLTELYSKGEITDIQFDKAVRILESGEKNKLLEKFLSDKISLTTFKRVFR